MRFNAASKANYSAGIKVMAALESTLMTVTKQATACDFSHHFILSLHVFAMDNPQVSHTESFYNNSTSS